MDELANLTREQREQIYAQYARDQQAVNEAMRAELDKMKAEVQSEYRKNWQSKRQRFDFAYNELVKRHVEHQRQWGVAVPSAVEAGKAASAVMERLEQEQ